MSNFMDFDLFRTLANNYAGVIPPIKKTVDQLAESVDTVKKGWAGEANNAFSNFAGSLGLKISEVNKDLQAVSEALNTGEKNTSSSDHESMTGFTSLSTKFG